MGTEGYFLNIPSGVEEWRGEGRGRRNNLEKVPVNFHTLHMEGGIGSLLKNSLHLVQGCEALHANIVGEGVVKNCRFETSIYTSRCWIGVLKCFPINKKTLISAVFLEILPCS